MDVRVTFSAQTRKEALNYFKKNKLDLLIIGGGVTGAGMALHGAARQSKVGLIDMQDFAGGTSSRSTKLVHGGLRYLKQFDVELVADVAKERAIIGKNAPHIAKPSYMLMPIYDEPGASFTPFSAKVALHLYDCLAEVNEEWAHYMVEAETVLKNEPTLKVAHLEGGGFYLDYTNDDSRLTLEIIKKAHDYGAHLANYVKAIAFIYDEKKHIIGVRAQDKLTEEVFDIEAEVVVNASGPWSDEVRKKRSLESEKRMYPTKGVHLVVDHKDLPVRQTIYTDSGQEDDRMIFIIPRGGKTYFGTTDTPFEGPYEELSVTEEDVSYLLQAVNHRFAGVKLTRESIETSWAGLRPLIQDEDNSDPSGISRGHDIFISEDGLISIVGGKLTDYRRMAEDAFQVVDEEWDKKGLSFGKVDTKTIPLSGGSLPEGQTLEVFSASQREKGQAIGLTQEESDDLAQWYGSNVWKVFALKDEAASYPMPLKDALQLAYAITHEMAMTPEDFFARRTDSLLFAIHRLEELKEGVLTVFQKKCGWSDEERVVFEKDLNERVAETTLAHLKNKT